MRCLDPFDGPAGFLNGIDQGPDVPSNVIEEMDGGHFFRRLFGGIRSHFLLLGKNIDAIDTNGRNKDEAEYFFFCAMR